MPGVFEQWRREPLPRAALTWTCPKAGPARPPLLPRGCRSRSANASSERQGKRGFAQVVCWEISLWKLSTFPPCF